MTGPVPAPAGGNSAAAWFEKNKTVALGGGVAVVVVLALVSRSRSGEAATGTGGAAAPASQSLSAGGQVAGGVYDSTASDLYSALSPELSSISQSLEKLNGSGTPATPVPAAPKPLTRTFADGFYRVAGEDTIYRVGAGGTQRDWLAYNEATALGFTTKDNKGLTLVSADDNRWAKTKLVGAGPQTISIPKK